MGFMSGKYRALVTRLYELCDNNFLKAARECGLSDAHLHKVYNGKGPKEPKQSSVRRVEAAINRLERPRERQVESLAGYISMKNLGRLRALDDFLTEHPEYLEDVEDELRKFGFGE